MTTTYTITRREIMKDNETATDQPSPEGCGSASAPEAPRTQWERSKSNIFPSQAWLSTKSDDNLAASLGGSVIGVAGSVERPRSRSGSAEYENKAAATRLAKPAQPQGDKGQFKTAAILCPAVLAHAEALAEALEGLASQIQLGRLNIRKDFSLMNHHAAATKALAAWKARGE